MQVKEENICPRVISPRKKNRAEGKDKEQGVCGEGGRGCSFKLIIGEDLEEEVTWAQH